MKPYHTFCSLLEHPEVKDMMRSTQHKNTDTYSHCRNVTLRSVWIIRHMKIKADVEAVVRGAMLHDFRLNEMKEEVKDEKISSWQCVRMHPERALSEAEQIFDLSWKEKNIIYSHMWPIRFAHLQKCKEAVIVNVADKWCAIEERFMSHRMDEKRVKEINFLKEVDSGMNET